jgi:serine protease AprX
MRQILTGRGIGVAILDTGIYPHVDFDNRILAFQDMINNKASMYDDNGHGTHIAGVLAGSGKNSGGRYRGIAPEAGIAAVKILYGDGTGSSGDAIRGMEWILQMKKELNIRIVNISIGTTNASNDVLESAMIEEAEKLWENGIVVVAAAGNNGPGEGTVTSPGISRKIITVGAYDEMFVRRGGKWKKYYSGQGPTQECIMKPEIVARGNRVIGCANQRYGYQEKSGTSMAAPYVSGMIARLLQKYPDMSPKDVKIRLHDRAVDLGLPKSIQGWGTINETLF